MSINLDCYMQFKKEVKDSYVTCGVVLVHGSEEIFTDFQTFENGLYGDGLLTQLFKTMQFINDRIVNDEGGVNLFIKVHPKNTNFIKILNKIERGYQLTKTVDNEVSFNFIMKQHFTNKDHTKPKTYDWMIRIVKALKIVNKKQPLSLIASKDGVSFRAQRVYLECCARHTAHEQVAETTNVIEFPSPQKTEIK
jgi:hypothetical protein